MYYYIIILNILINSMPVTVVILTILYERNNRIDFIRLSPRYLAHKKVKKHFPIWNYSTTDGKSSQYLFE